MKTIAVMPAYNEEKNISSIIKETKKYVDDVIIVSDGSTDSTNKIAKQAGAITLKEESVRGKGNALIKAIKYLDNISPDIVIFMDSDGQHNPTEIPRFIKAIENYDLVIGSRFKGVIKTTFLNIAGNHLLNILHFLITKKWISDVESGFRAFKYEKLKELNITASNYEIESDMLIESINKKLKIMEIPINIVRSEKGITSKDGLKIAKFVLKKGFRK